MSAIGADSIGKGGGCDAAPKARKPEEPLETWVWDPKPTDPDVAKICRQMLQIFLNSPEGKEPNFRKWAQQGIGQATRAEAQELDPLFACHWRNPPDRFGFGSAS